MPRRLSNSNDRPNGASLCLRLAQSASVEEALEDLAEIAAEKGIHLYSIRVKRGRLEREFKPSNNVAAVGKINEIEASVEGRQTQLVVKFLCRRMCWGFMCASPRGRGLVSGHRPVHSIPEGAQKGGS